MHGLVDPETGPSDQGAVVHSRGDVRRRVDELKRKGVITDASFTPPEPGSGLQHFNRKPKPHG